MSRSRRLFKLIAPSVPGTVLCKDMLVLAPTRHILRAFLLEATMEKGRVYLWRVVTPLFRPMKNVLLTYSHRIPETGTLYITESAFHASADTVRAIVGEHVDYLRGLETPEDFLRHAAWVVDGSPIMSRVDQALARYLAGDVARGADALRALKAEADSLDDARRERIAPRLDKLVSTLNAEPPRLASLLQEWEDANVEKLGLQPSRAGVGGNRVGIGAT